MIAISKLEVRFSNERVAPRKETMLKARREPQKIPNTVDFDKIFFKKKFKSFTEKIMTPIVDIIIPKMIMPDRLSFNIMSAKKAICMTSVLLNVVPTTKLENLKE